MNAPTFPTITGDIARSYIATARLTPNAVAARIHRLLGAGSPQLIRRCMYCNAYMGTKPCVPEMHGKESHGVCDACLPRMEREFGLSPSSAMGAVGVADSRGAGGGDYFPHSEPWSSTGPSVPAKDSREGHEIGLRPAVRC